MKLELGKSQQVFKNCVTLLTKLNEDLPLKVDAEGIHIISMDPSHVAMTKMTIKPDLFDSYTAAAEGEVVTLNVKELVKFLDRLDKDDEVTIETAPEEAKIHIIAKRSKSRRKFSIALLEPSEDEVPSPKIFFKSKAKIVTKALKGAVTDAGLVSEHVRVSLEGLKDKNETLKISASGDMGSAHGEWEKGSDDLLDIKIEEDSSASYTLSYLNELIPSVMALSDSATIEISTDMPMKLSFDTGKIECDLYLAPCIGV